MTQEQLPTPEEILSGKMSGGASDFDVAWENVSSLPDGTHEFILLFGDPATNPERNPDSPSYNENKKQWAKTFDRCNAVYKERCSLFTNEQPNGKFVAEWFYTHSKNDPGHVLGLDNRPNSYGGVWPYPQEIWTIPVLSDFSTKDGEWDGNSGKFTYLSMNTPQWNAILRETGKLAVKFANLENKGLKLVKNTSKGTKGTDMYQWSMPDPVTVYDIHAHLGDDFDAMKMLETERQNMKDKIVYGFYDEGAANVWAMLEEVTSLSEAQITNNPLYNLNLSETVGAKVDEVDLTLDTE